jgi:hypothetical protein
LERPIRVRVYMCRRIFLIHACEECLTIGREVRKQGSRSQSAGRVGRSLRVNRCRRRRLRIRTERACEERLTLSREQCGRSDGPAGPVASRSAGND